MLLHAWNLAALALCLALASLSLVRGLAGLIVRRNALGLLEAVVLVVAGVGGLTGSVLVYHIPA